MAKYMAGVILMLAGCSTYVFKLRDDEIVYCKDAVRDVCGISLSRCDNGLDYSCQQNIAEIRNDEARLAAIRMHEQEKKNPKKKIKKVDVDGWVI